MQSHIRKVHACLAVTYHLHFWQNDRYLLRATAETLEWNGYRSQSRHRRLTLEKKLLLPFLQGLEPATGRGVCVCVCVFVCVCVRVRVRVLVRARARMRACVRACVCLACEK